MKESFLNKYKPKKLSDFYLSNDCMNLIETLFKMNNLNILFIGCNGTGKTSIIQAIVRKYYDIDKIYNENILHINCLKEQGIQYYRK